EPVDEPEALLCVGERQALGPLLRAERRPRVIVAAAPEPFADLVPARPELFPQLVGEHAARRTHAHAVVFQPDADAQRVEVHQQFSAAHTSSSSKSSFAFGSPGRPPFDVRRRARMVTPRSFTVAAARMSPTVRSTS